ncbi:hypothetical protein [Nocardia sp. CNY236]|uniref:hypothetical protein n=1 Tax=Nocardia sp. CNY236 TaxID=1169152 RepID=UPI00041FF905|nr:hypothetical protein [Nocardia sp. CNY236]
MHQNEPKRIPGGGENPHSWSHQEIKESFGALDDYGDAQDAAEKYAHVASWWDQGVETFARAMVESIGQAWEGAAADAAKDAIKRYTDDARTLEPALTQLAYTITESVEAVVATRNAIPDYADHSWTANVWPPRAAEEERSRNEAEQGAREAMRSNYVARFSGVDARVPVLPVALDPTQPLDIAGSGPDGTGGGNPPNTVGPRGSVGSDDLDGNEGASEPAGSSTPVGTQDPAWTSSVPDEVTPAGAEPGTAVAGDDPTRTTAAGAEPGVSNALAGSEDRGSTSGRNIPGGASPAGGPGALGGPGGSGVLGMPGGRGGTGVPGGSGMSGSSGGRAGAGGFGGPGASSGSGVRGAPGGPGGAGMPGGASGVRSASGGAGAAAVSGRGAATPGMMGPGMGAGGGKSDYESNRTTPDYLVTQENTDELLGEMPKTVPGGVIGGDRRDS